jgi:hypothetical protein
MRAYPNPSLAGRRVSHRFSVLALSSLGRRARRRRLYLQQVFGAMPHRSKSHRRSSHVVMVTPLDRAAPLPLEHPAAITCKEPAFDPSATRGRTRRPRSDAPCAIRRRFTRAGVQCAPLRSRGLSSPEVRHVAIGHGEAAHVSLAPGPEPCSLIAAVAARRLPRDVTCPMADRGGTSCMMQR